MTHAAWPALPLGDWEPTYLTLHRWTQIVGKLRLALAPWLNHWWHVTLFVSSRGLTTGSIPFGDRELTIVLDFVEHRLLAETSDGRAASFDLRPMTVAEFYARMQAALAQIDVRAPIWPVPVEVVDTTPFPRDTRHAAYDRAKVERLHHVLIHLDRVLSTHRGQFLGKSSPVHFFWGSFDLAVSRYSGRRNPTPPTDPIMSEAYSHEVISHGFWPGGDWPLGGRVVEPVFYAYAVPEPQGLAQAVVRPREAKYSHTLREFVLPYEAVRTSPDPAATLLEFMETTYLAAAERAGWDVDAFRHPHARAVAPPNERQFLRERSAEMVFQDHLELANEHLYEKDIERNYAEDCVVLTGDAIYRGHDGVRTLARRLEQEIPRARFEYRTKRVDGSVAFLEWAAHEERSVVDDGTDTFVIHDGHIVTQTIHYTVKAA